MIYSCIKYSSVLPVWRGSCLATLSSQLYSHCLVGWLVWQRPVFATLIGYSSNQSHNEPRDGINEKKLSSVFNQAINVQERGENGRYW